MTKGKHRTYADHIDNYRRGGMRFGVLGGKLLHRLGRDIDMKELLPQLGATQGGTEMNVMKNPLDAISALAGLAQSRNDPMAALSALSALSGRPASAASGAAGASGAAASGAASGGANPADLLSLLATLKPPQRANAAPNGNSANGAAGSGAANGGDQANRSGNAPGGTGFAGQSGSPYGEQRDRYAGAAQDGSGDGAAQAYAADGFGTNGSAPYARYEQRSAPGSTNHASSERGREGFAAEEPYERSRADARYAGYERSYNDFREENRQMPPHEHRERGEKEREKPRRGYDSLRERAERIYQREPHDACEHCEEPCGFRNYPSWKQVNMQTAPWRRRHQ